VIARPPATAVDQAHRAVGKPTLHLGARQAMFLEQVPGPIGHGKLEYRLRDIDSHNGQSGGSIHLGLPSG